jgi:hypothetical protein
MLTDIMASRLAELTELFGRVYQLPEEQPPPRHEIEIEDA